MDSARRTEGNAGSFRGENGSHQESFESRAELCRHCTQTAQHSAHVSRHGISKNIVLRNLPERSGEDTLIKDGLKLTNVTFGRAEKKQARW
jgi:hypothetical protein